MYNDTAKNARPTPGLLYFHPNHLGSTALVTDDAGDLVSEIHYKPYGEVIRSASSGPDSFRKKYTGQEEDPETSLMYYNARYYDPAIGRFISQDSMVDPGAGSQGFNRYMYVGGNPVMGTDPSGHFVDPISLMIIGAIIGGMMGGVSGAMGCDCSGSEQLAAFAGGFVIGALAGAAGGGLGAVVANAGASGFLVGLAGGFVGGAISGAGNALMNGTDVALGFAQGAMAGAVIGGLMGVAGDLVGKISSELKGISSDLLSGKRGLTSVGLGWEENPFWNFLSDSPGGRAVLGNETARAVSKKVEEFVASEAAKTLAENLSKTAQYLDSLQRAITELRIIIDPVSQSVTVSYYNNGFHSVFGEPEVAVNGSFVSGSGGVSEGYFPQVLGEVASSFGGAGVVIKGSRYALKALKASKYFAKGGNNISKLINSAKQLYPKLAEKTHLHHITPKYLGGAANGPMVSINGAYHQLITNEFRALWGYGRGIPSSTQLQEIMKAVYTKYPIPGGF